MHRSCTRFGAAMLFSFALPSLGLAQTFVEIVPPNSSYSFPYGIRDGKVVGTYGDATTGQNRGFAYSRGSGYVTFAVQTTDPYAGTVATGIDSFGRIFGYYSADYRVRGFVRSPNGSIQPFDADYPQPFDTYTYESNTFGATIGEYRAYGDENTPRSFLRTPLGLILHIQVPSAGVNVASGINDGGTINGFWAQDLNSTRYGFIRSPLGYYTTYTTPAGCDFEDSTIHHMNNRGDVAGSCSVSPYGESGYIRWHDGTMIKVDYPGSGNTELWGIADNGDAAGSYYLPGSGVHGFIRKANGTFISFDAPGSDLHNTYVNRIDAQGNLIGTYYDVDGHGHSYVRYNDSH